jgi:hypothetical protein
MAEDSESKRAEGALAAYDEGADEVYRPAPRKPKNLSKRSSLPTFESSIDRFITDAKAEPHKHDVSYFDREAHALALAKEVEELKTKLVAAETRADAAREAEVKAKDQALAIEPPVPAKRSWGGIVAGFAVGAACMFGVTRWLTPPAPVAQVAAPAAPKLEPASVVADVPPPPAVIEPAPAAPPVIEPQPPEPVPSKLANTTKRPLSRPATKVAPKPDKPTEPKPVETKPATDPGLYNPF